MRSERLEVESELALFGRFSRAFTHILRGDLSVITNEISYLATKLPSGELDRATNRCSQMASTISKIAGLNGETRIELVSYEEIARMYGATISGSHVTGGVFMDRVRAERLALMVRHLFGEEFTSCVELSPSGEGMIVRLTAAGHCSERREYVSWSAFAGRERGERYVIEGVVADLLTRACAWEIAIRVGEGEVTARIAIRDVGMARGE